MFDPDYLSDEEKKQYICNQQLNISIKLDMIGSKRSLFNVRVLETTQTSLLQLRDTDIAKDILISDSTKFMNIFESTLKHFNTSRRDCDDLDSTASRLNSISSESSTICSITHL